MNHRKWLALGTLAGGLLLAAALLALFAPRALAAPTVPAPLTAALPAAPFYDDFEGGLPAGFAGFADSWNSSGSATALAYAARPAEISLFPASPANNAVVMTYTVAMTIPNWGGAPGWAGVVRDFTAPLDWNGYATFSLWVRGSNSGQRHFIEIKSDGNDATNSNRYVYPLEDDFSGWKFVNIPFGAFAARTGYNPGPNPAAPVNLSRMWGYAILLDAGSAGVMALDNVTVSRYLPLHDFEVDYPTGFVGFADSWSSSGSATSLVMQRSPELIPVIPTMTVNSVVSVTYSVALTIPNWGGAPGWAGVTFDAPSLLNWNDYQGFGFWYNGSGSGDDLRVELKSAGASAANSNRYVYTLTNDLPGWRWVELPFEDFVRRMDHNPGPNPAAPLDRTQIWGYSLLLSPGAAGTFQLDQVCLYGPEVLGPQVNFATPVYAVNEGEMATITATLSVSATTPVTVSYASADGSALAGSDYTAASGVLVFAPGETEAAFTLATLPDETDEPKETVRLLLSNPLSATLGAASMASLAIVDDDASLLAPENIRVFDDFGSGLAHGTDSYANPVGFVVWGSATNTWLTTTVVTATDALALPIQEGENALLQVDTNIAAGGYGGFTHAFENPAANQWVSQDWSRYAGVSFWVYGTHSGGEINFDILDNRTTTGDSCERWSYVIPDDFSGWKYFTIPFGEFVRKGWQPGGAPDDGLTLTEVWGYAIGFPANAGERRHYLDNIGLMVRTRIVDDFNNGLPQGFDSYANAVGFVVWGDAPNTALTTTVISATDPLALPPILSGDNALLKVDYNIGGWGGFTHAFENATVDRWVSQNWSTYEGVSFWVYGTHSGGPLNLDLFDNRTTTGDSCERWTYIFPDDFNGWKYFVVPFEQFTRKGWQPGGAPDDGLTLTEVWGYAFGFPAAVGARTNYLDLFTVYGNITPPPVEVRVQLSAAAYEGTEGSTAAITVTLNTTSSLPVSVTYTTLGGSATPGRDYLPAAGMLVFAPGSTLQTFDLVTLADNKYEGNENVQILLSQPVNAIFGPVKQAALAIGDDDPFDPYLLDDFETPPYLFYADGNLLLSTLEITASSPLALPGQGTYETILAVDLAPSEALDRFGTTFAQSQDWSASDGLSFWYYGTDSGQEITVTLQDNRASEPAPAGWELAWSDEFSGTAGTAPDAAHWTPEIGDGTLNGNPGWGNAEREYYTGDPENVAMDGSGNLVITAREVNTATTNLQCYYGPCEYTSARLISAGKAEFAYGRVEARLKLPYGPGIWPAFWMLGNDIDQVNWPQSGELDIMENIGREPNTVHGTVHGPGYSGGDGIGGGYTITDALSADYHVYAIEWEPDRIRWFIDETNYFTITSSDIPTGTEWVFDHPFYLIMNVAVGGYWPGYPDPTSTFPQSLYIDYVRVYQPADSAERFEAGFVDDFTGWQKVTIPFGDFQRSAAQPPNAPDDGLTLTEVWGYGFELPAGLPERLYFDHVQLEASIVPTTFFLPLVRR